MATIEFDRRETALLITALRLAEQQLDVVNFAMRTACGVVEAGIGSPMPFDQRAIEEDDVTRLVDKIISAQGPQS